MTTPAGRVLPSVRASLAESPSGVKATEVTLRRAAGYVGPAHCYPPAMGTLFCAVFFARLRRA